MRAVWLHEFGGPGVLVVADAPDPVAEAGQAVIEVAFANITFVDTQFRASGFGPFNAKLPMIPGNGIGGIVIAVGSQADSGLVGKQVVSSTGGSGGYAERAVVDASNLFEVPDGLALDHAVALLADGRTASLLIQVAGLHRGERVLVEAAAGGVGTLLVQLAKSAGTRVVAVAGGARKVEIARDLGADVVVDYSEPDWVGQAREAVGSVDVVFDGVGGSIGRSAFELLDRGGRMVCFGRASGQWTDISEEAAAGRGVTLVNWSRPTSEEMRTLTEGVLTLAAAGRLQPMIGQRFPLDQAAQAHMAIESRATVGKTLLEVQK